MSSRSKMGKRYSYPLYDKILREKDEISSQYVANRDNIPYIVARSNRRKRRGGISRIESSSPSSSKPSFAARQPYPTSSIFRLREKKRQKGEKTKQLFEPGINESCPSSCPPSSRPIAQIDHQNNKPCLPSPLLITYIYIKFCPNVHQVPTRRR